MSYTAAATISISNPLHHTEAAISAQDLLAPLGPKPRRRRWILAVSRRDALTYVQREHGQRIAVAFGNACKHQVLNVEFDTLSAAMAQGHRTGVSGSIFRVR